MSLGYDRNGVIKHIIKNKIYQKTSSMIEKLLKMHVLLKCDAYCWPNNGGQ